MKKASTFLSLYFNSEKHFEYNTLEIVSTAALFNMVATSHMWPFKFKLDAATWMDIEIITPSEVSRAEKDKYHLLLTCGI